MDKMIKTREAAAIFGIHYKTILNYIHAGKLRAIRLPGGQLRISEAEINHFIEKRTTIKIVK